ncbi:hypothetical protein HF1_08360 [Mycoplasma haemofelis str. Langford 1]|uniref:Uncharacterized protein n=2 Tax=Mycoplasma haemofelis TaxID=29501 RepID=F6FIX5_MYCHI|nr:hypothetical protein [Mycoplasma haemofelis]AEG73173.1 hypothetical protein MHF_0916 [Mycoplasma haemofelis Ohio2]CBY92844.1 hypothetical protein HF1_08360 [Mycoplasma haemofelis str. Langford 1]
MDPKLLGLTGALGTAAAGGGIYWSVQASKQSISSLLASERGVLLIKDRSDSTWNDAWKKYKDSSGNKWGIKDWSAKQSLQDAPDEFKEECEKRASEKVSSVERQEYKDVRNWCTRPKKVVELLNSEGKKVLLSQTGDDKEWNDSWTKYKKHHENKPASGSQVTYKSDDELGVSSFSNKTTQDNAPTEYKTACQTKSELHIDETKITEDPNFQKVEKWCTKDKS